ncbi:hypothetical protein ACFX2F_006072 [Malus domestica]
MSSESFPADNVPWKPSIDHLLINIYLASFRQGSFYLLQFHITVRMQISGDEKHLIADQFSSRVQFRRFVL